MKAFKLLIPVLAIADGRRREQFCSDEYGHDCDRLATAGSEDSHTAR
ncbi:hypothetical protein [Streptomyces sp. NPDC020667]